MFKFFRKSPTPQIEWITPLMPIEQELKAVNAKLIQQDKAIRSLHNKIDKLADLLQAVTHLQTASSIPDYQDAAHDTMNIAESLKVEKMTLDELAGWMNDIWINLSNGHYDFSLQAKMIAEIAAQIIAKK